jgi:hypothetical protein
LSLLAGFVENENATKREPKENCSLFCRELARNYVLLLYHRVDFFFFSKWIGENVVIFVQICTKNQPAATFIVVIF